MLCRDAVRRKYDCLRIFSATGAEDKHLGFHIHKQLHLSGSAQCVKGTVIKGDNTVFQIQRQFYSFHVVSSNCNCASSVTGVAMYPSRKFTLVDIS